jgi:hypothetical protein
VGGLGASFGLRLSGFRFCRLDTSAGSNAID